MVLEGQRGLGNLEKTLSTKETAEDTGNEVWESMFTGLEAGTATRCLKTSS